MTKRIYFDMDGTIADLYGRDGWLDSLINEEAGLFQELKPMYPAWQFREICDRLQREGWELGVITWTPMNATREYEEQVAREKIYWLQNYAPFIKDITCQPYGQPKQYAIRQRATRMILVDDNHEVRQMWEKVPHRETIDATKNIIDELEKLLDK